MEPAPYFFSIISSNYYNNMLEIYHIIISVVVFECIREMCFSFLVMVDVSRSRRLHGSWVSVFYFLRSNNFHDYVNRLIIGTFGIWDNRCTGLWITIWCNDSLWHLTFQMATGERHFQFPRCVMFWSNRLLWQWSGRRKVKSGVDN